MPLLQSSLRAIRATQFKPVRQCRFYSDEIAKVGDILLLKNNNSSTSKPVLTPPLITGNKIKLQHDSISHDDIIGKELGSAAVASKKRVQYRIHRPTLGDYTDNSPRIVTPIYSQDASLIVSLLDLHPSVPNPDNSDEKLQIFEAGTGHGALTLFLSRAIHGANTVAPSIPEPEEADVGKSTEYTEWLSQRRAIIHTLDISSRHSAHAQKTVKNFRGGMYYPNIDFHVGDIDSWITTRLEERDGKPFLDHAILDLPDTHANMEVVGRALKANGILITFCPSITQVNTCFEMVKEGGLPLFLEQVLEIGGTGGREWDVRRVKVRERESVHGNVNGEEIVEGASEAQEGLVDEAVEPAEQRWEMICRPKVGARVVGGGFVGVWRKKAF